MSISPPVRRLVFRASHHVPKRPRTPIVEKPSGSRGVAYADVKYDELDYLLMATFPASDAIARY